jgi:hypothetical protein
MFKQKPLTYPICHTLHLNGSRVQITAHLLIVAAPKLDDCRVILSFEKGQPKHDLDCGFSGEDFFESGGMSFQVR